MRQTARRATIFICLALAACRGGTRDAAGRSQAPLNGPGTAPATLVGDVRVGLAPADSSPHGFVVSGGVAYFAADDGSSGFEPWRSDGSDAGTALARDIRPGEASSLPASGRLEAVAFAGGVLFAADDGARGTELWFSDGTEAGTALVRDIELGSGSSNPRSLVAIGGNAFFVADTREAGAELWTTDGTEAGTVMVRDIVVGPAGSTPSGLAAVGSTLFFAATDGSGTRLWKSNGQGAGTARVVSSGAHFPAHLAAFGGQVFFAGAVSSSAGAQVRLWRSDGTTTSMVGDATAPSDLTPLLLGAQGPRLYYSAAPASAPATRELFSTGGSDQTQHTLDDERPGPVAAAGGHVFFSADRPGSPAFGRELHTLTATGQVERLVDAAPGPASSDPAWLTDVGGGILLFTANVDGTRSLFRSDGTPANTMVVKDGPDFREIARAGDGRAVLAAWDSASGDELWQSDGTLNGTVIVKNARPDDAAGSEPRELTAWNGRLYYSADDGLLGRELWVADPVAGTADVFYDLSFDAQSSTPADLAAWGGVLLFGAATPDLGRELWRTDGISPPELVQDVFPGAFSSRPAEITPAATAALFAADGPAPPGTTSVGRELWMTDGTTASLVKDIWSGADAGGVALSSRPSGLIRAGGNVWFVADDGDPTNPFAKLYRSDGTAAGTLPADVLDCKDRASATYPEDFAGTPDWIAALGSTAVFSASSWAYGREVFRAGETGCTTLLRDVAPGFDDSNPVAFAVHGGAGYFGALDADPLDPAPRYALWRTDGLPAGTARVAFVGLIGGGSIASVASMDPDGVRTDVPLLFVGNDEEHGPEPWASDGTAAGTRMLADGYGGPLGSAEGAVFLRVPSRGRALFAAADPAHGRELWISDGTALGTRLLHDVRPGPMSSNPTSLTLVQGADGRDYVYFVADDSVPAPGGTVGHGRELWVLDMSPDALDLVPPVPDCPASFTFEATSPTGADVTYAITATDDRGPAGVTISYDPPSGSHLVYGITVVTARVLDSSSNAAECRFDAIVQDTSPPTLTCPADQHLEATGPSGAVATFEAQAVDTVTIPVDPVLVPTSGSWFPLGPGRSPGITTVNVTASDLAANVSTCAFTITVSDTTAPDLTCPPDVGQGAGLEATSVAGAPATWSDAVATDAVSVSSIDVAYRRPDGSEAIRDSSFAVGVTTVSVSAADEAGNVANCSFTIRVVDTLAPVVTCPSLDPFEATTFGGGPVTFEATAVDTATASPAISYDRAPGSFFGLGTTPVTATARDGSGNAASCTFDVTVRDTTPPVIACPGPLFVAEATGPSGAAVIFDATALDSATAFPQTSYAPPRGSFFLLDQVVPVTATAVDDAGLSSSCTFDVTVRDSTPPALVRCPFEHFTEATGPDGATVTYPRDFAHDLVTMDADLAYSYSQPAGDPQPLGSAAVTGWASDSRGNPSAPCDFTSTVRDTTAPVALCPAAFTAEATGPEGADVSWPEATGIDSVTLALAPATYDAVPGLFPLGPAVVHATLVDDALNAGTCEIRFAVVDTTPPALGCPMPAPVEATGPDGAAATFEAFPVDSVTAAPALSFVPASGDTFPVGETTVTATAWDDAQNVTTCTFAVTIVDTTPPTLECPATFTAEATSAGGAAVWFAVTDWDAVGVSTRDFGATPPGSTFPLGTTGIAVTVADAAGNSTSCATSVLVQDTTPPALTCPADRSIEANDATPVQFPGPAVSDAVTATPEIAISQTHHSGDVFPIGTTEVHFTATDAAANASQCTMRVTVTKLDESGGCGCGSGNAGSTGLLALLALALRARARGPRGR